MKAKRIVVLLIVLVSVGLAIPILLLTPKSLTKSNSIIAKKSKHTKGLTWMRL